MRTTRTESTPDLICIKGRHTDDYEAPFVFLLTADLQHVFSEIQGSSRGTIYSDIYHTREFSRLFGIKQLGTVCNTEQNTFNTQSRGFHSLVAAAMTDLVLYWNGFSKRERHSGIAAALCHDMATVPYSDQGKLIDPGAYEEETLIQHLLTNSEGLTNALKKHHISIDSVVRAIQGNGSIGKLINSRKGLDIDNLSYLSIDCMPFATDKIYPTFVPNQPGEIAALANTNLFTQYKNLKFIDGEWVFDDPQKLMQLLKFRALMYKSVYHCPDHRAREAFLTRTLRHYKQRGGRVDINTLLTWEDLQFEQWFSRTFGPEKFHDFFEMSFEHKPFIELDQIPVMRRDPEQVLAEVRKKREREDLGIIVERLKPPRDAAENFALVNGKVKLLHQVAFSEAPGLLEDLEDVKQIIQDLDYVGVYQRATA